MKKLIVLMAVLLVAGSAFAAGSRLNVVPNATFNNGTLPTSTNNDDTCDIASAAPAATLLLPYFEVDFNSPQTTARTTLFTIVNTTDLPQIAHVVLWTDWSFPALDFNIFLTGYDVQGINLYDIFARGQIAPGPTGATGGTSSNTTVPTNPTAGSQPAANTANTLLDLSQCANLPGSFANNQALLRDLQLIFTTGKATGAGIPCTAQAGSVHANAIGYATIDVMSSCNTSLPNQGAYFTQLLFDNVLIGDYQDINPNPATGNYAGGNPLVHIRAVPEGGPAGSFVVPTNLPFTFYDRYTTLAPAGNRKFDRRQPLPSAWAARYIQGGTGAFNTNFKIWREGYTAGACSTSLAANGAITIAEVVRFDEHENATVLSNGIISPAPGQPGTNETQALSTGSAFFPQPSISGDVGGWMYLNLNNGGVAPPPFNFNASFSQVRAGGPSQNWVIVSMFAEGRYSVDFDAAWLGNGCTPVFPLTGVPNGFIGPGGGALVCPGPGTGGPIVGGCTPGTGIFTGTNSTNPF
jgi:hypothetical protein